MKNLIWEMPQGRILSIAVISICLGILNLNCDRAFRGSSLSIGAQSDLSSLANPARKFETYVPPIGSLESGFGPFNLIAGQKIQFPGGNFAMQPDGNLVVYVNNVAVWAASDTPSMDNLPVFNRSCSGCVASFQSDGNLVLYNGNKAYWQSATFNHSKAILLLNSSAPNILITENNVRLFPNFDKKIESDLDLLFSGKAGLKEFATLQLPTRKGSSDWVGMNFGTSIVPLNGIWYLFNREYGYTASPSVCLSNAVSRIRVRSSTDHGLSWSEPVTLAEPNFAIGECQLNDGKAFFDQSAATWHYLTQVLQMQPDGSTRWNINHYTRIASDPIGAFQPDSGNPVIRSGSLWSKICAGTGKNCPSNSGEEGTPEIAFKSGKDFYVTFHGAAFNGQITTDKEGNSAGVVTGYRGVAKTSDFHNWRVQGEDLPGDAFLSSRDCQTWNAQWASDTGCIGTGSGRTLKTSNFIYFLGEASDKSLICVDNQQWGMGLLRSKNFSKTGTWQSASLNPIIWSGKKILCDTQYSDIFIDDGTVYITYWTMPGADSNTYMHFTKVDTSGTSPTPPVYYRKFSQILPISYTTLSNSTGCQSTDFNSASCRAAYSRFCQSSGFVTGYGAIEANGSNLMAYAVCLMQTASSSIASSYTELNGYVGTCSASSPVSTSCDSAVSRLCAAKGYTNGGFGPIEFNSDINVINCLNQATSLLINDSLVNLQAIQPTCGPSTIQGMACKSAISRSCQQKGYNSGIGAMEFNSVGVNYTCVK